ncbi:hypothetical protein V2J09_018421 [Rumex salicifolius]
MEGIYKRSWRRFFDEGKGR